jgi:hypothetical protein
MKLQINLSDKERLRVQKLERENKLLEIAKQLQSILDTTNFDTKNTVYTVMIKNNKILTISD